MSRAGLLCVGAVPLCNGPMLLDGVPARAAEVRDLFVGGMRVMFPTIIPGGATTGGPSDAEL